MSYTSHTAYKSHDGRINSDSEEEFDTVDDLAKTQQLISCYQMQVDDDNNCSPVYLGRYPDVPLPVNKIINYNNYKLHVVTYVITEDEVKNKLYKIVGVNVFKEGKRNSMCSLDLVLNHEKGNYQLLFNDHRNNTTDIVETLEKFPGKDKILEYVITKAFDDPVKSVLLKDKKY